MRWIVEFDDDFEPEFRALEARVQDTLLASAKPLSDFGPQLGRPYADTLNGSKHANMKELRFEASGGVWRVAFAFDPRRRAILLIPGDKSGGSQRRFLRPADRRGGQAVFDASGPVEEREKGDVRWGGRSIRSWPTCRRGGGSAWRGGIGN